MSPRWLVVWVAFFSGFGVRGALRTLPAEAHAWLSWGAVVAQVVLAVFSFVGLVRAKRALRASKDRLERHLALFRGDA